MSETKYIKVPGIASWNHVYKPDDFMNSLNYKITIIINEATKALIQKYDLQGKFTPHESGDETYTFRRPAEKMIKKKWVSFAPPVIYGKDGKVLCEYTYNGEVVQSVNDLVEYDKFEPTGEQPLIGHGSEVLLDVCVYGSVKGNGARLQSIKLVDLIEYIPDNAGTNGSSVDQGSVTKDNGGAGTVGAENAKAPW